MPYRVFNLQEVAFYLHLTTADVEVLVHRHEIPFEKQGGRVIFRKKEVDAWASQRILKLQDSHLKKYHEGSTANVSHARGLDHCLMPERLRPEFIEPRMLAKTKSSVLRDMVTLAERTQLLYSPADLLQSLQEREELCSTALPNGLALLHPRHHDPFMFEESFILLARAAHPIPFGAPDGQKTDVFFLICCKDDKIHLHILARVCLMVSRTLLLEEIRAATGPDGIYRAVCLAELTVTGKLSA